MMFRKFRFVVDAIFKLAMRYSLTQLIKSKDILTPILNVVQRKAELFHELDELVGRVDWLKHVVKEDLCTSFSERVDLPDSCMYVILTLPSRLRYADLQILLFHKDKEVLNYQYTIISEDLVEKYMSHIDIDKLHRLLTKLSSNGIEFRDVFKQAVLRLIDRVNDCLNATQHLIKAVKLYVALME